MATKDSTRTYARFLAAQQRVSHGLQLQHRRIISRTADAPRLPVGPNHDVIDLRGDPGNDIDYYVYELARLQDLAREINNALGEPSEVVDALAAFEVAIPALRRIRNPLTHPSDDERLDGVAWFDAVVKLQPDGAVEYLVDPRYSHHDAALEFIHALSRYLEREVQATRGAAGTRDESERH
jgi:hypothetical protein